MGTREFNPPYLAFKTMTNLFDKLAETGIPNRIDRTYLGYLSGITQTYLLAALRTFGLLREDDRPTDKLVAFVNEPERRSELMAELVRDHYPEALALGTGATPGELSDLFRDEYGVTGDTNRKAITFFLNAAQFGNVPVSRHYKMPRAGGGASSGGSATPRKRRVTRKRETPPGDKPDAATSVDALRTRYINMLMKRAEEGDELDESLLDRIESLLGYEQDEVDEPEE